MPDDRPVFVDPTGRRRRTIRTTAVAGAGALFASGGLLIAALLGAPIGPPTFLPEPVPPPAAVDEPQPQPAPVTTSRARPTSGTGAARDDEPSGSSTPAVSTTPTPAATTTTTNGRRPDHTPPGRPTDLPPPPGHTR